MKNNDGQQNQHSDQTNENREKLPLELALEEAMGKSQAPSPEKKDLSTSPVESPVVEEPKKEKAEEKTASDYDSSQDSRVSYHQQATHPTEIYDVQKSQKFKGPRPSYMRSTPPQQSRATFLPSPDDVENYSDVSSEPINSSTNEEIAGIARADRASARAFSHAPRATRSGRAARNAGLDMTEEYRSKGKFRQSMQAVRQQHPFIIERPLTITDDEAKELIVKIRSVPLYKVQDLSMDLNSEESKRLFHALLLIDDNQTYRAIQQLAQQRASWSLYTIGWSTLQRNFPNRWVQQTLEVVYNTLESDPSRSEVRPSYMRKAIADLVNLSKSDNGFVTDVVRHMNQEYNISPDEGLEAFISDYLILIDTAFGGSVLGDFFRKAELPVLYKKKDMLCQSLPYMHPALSAEVVSRVIASKEPIEGDKKYIYRQIADIFLHREANHPMWPYMSADLNRAYKRWYIDDRIDNQTMMYPGKREFLQTYIEDIDDVAMLSNDLMAIRFDDFILIDDRKRGDGLTFYDNDTVKDMLLKGLDEKDLGNPSIPSRNVREAVQSNRMRGVIRLNFSQGNLQSSRQFMDILLGHGQKRRRENILKNWFR